MHSINGVKLVGTEVGDIKSARVIDPEKRFLIDWERYERLSVTACLIRSYLPNSESCRILDLNGWDGALALFVPEYNIDVCTDATVGSAATENANLHLPVQDHSYEMVVSVGDIEHLPKTARKAFIEEISRITKNYCLIGFPNAASIEAQRLVYALTNDVNIKEHIDYGLPERVWVESELQRHAFICETVSCVDLALWMAQFVLETVAHDKAAQVSAYLVRQQEAEVSEKALYLIVSGSRKLV